MQQHNTITPPVIWAIGGSDCSGHSGVQADIRTLHQLGAHGVTVITAITAQNTQQIDAIYPISIQQVLAQYHALLKDLPPLAIKIGMAPQRHIFNQLLPLLAQCKAPIICDPVMKSSTGYDLSDQPSICSLQQHAQYIDLLTPNRLEAEQITGQLIQTEMDMIIVAKALHQQGFKRVLLKGGHLDTTTTPEFVSDYYSDQNHRFWLTTDKITHHHNRGTGCTLATAIAAFIAQGRTFEDAAVLAKGYIQQGLKRATQIGQGPGPVQQTITPINANNLPIVTDGPFNQRQICSFAPHPTEQMGLYAVVDNLAQLERMIRLAIPVIQLRIKDQPLNQIAQQIKTAVVLANQSRSKLYINDYWQLACQYGAYGVHLGQEDLDTADLSYIAQHGLRLGISTHCEYELQRAQALNPSYIALGPIFATNSKPMRFAPQGIERLRDWRRYVDRPLVAIGGINFSNIDLVKATGADGIAMISGLRDSNDATILMHH